MVQMLADLTTTVLNAISTVTTDYDTVRDENGCLIYDDNGKPMRDARDLPPATGSSPDYRSVDLSIVRGRQSPAATDRPDNTYKVTHVEVDTDHEFKDTFGQHFAINRKQARMNPDIPTYHDIPPRYLTHLERVKRLESNIDQIRTELDVEVTIDRLSPIAFKLSDFDTDADRHSVRVHLTMCLYGDRCGPGVTFYDITEDTDTGDMYVWAKHVYSYPDWRDEAEQYAAHGDTDE